MLELFRRLAEVGHDLLALHLLESPKLDKSITSYAGPKIPEVGRVGWSNGTVWLDASKTNARQGHRATRTGTIGFQSVPEEVWDFHIGGYQVCHKWLKDRKGRALLDEDLAHYQKIVVALYRDHPYHGTRSTRSSKPTAAGPTRSIPGRRRMRHGAVPVDAAATAYWHSLGSCSANVH